MIYLKIQKKAKSFNLEEIGDYILQIFKRNMSSKINRKCYIDLF